MRRDQGRGDREAGDEQRQPHHDHRPDQASSAPSPGPAPTLPDLDPERPPAAASAACRSPARRACCRAPSRPAARRRTAWRPARRRRRRCATSAAANIEPRAKQTTASGTTERHGIGGRAAGRVARRLRHGWVPRCAARYSEPADAADQRDRQPGPGVPRGGEHGGDGRADDEDRLVDHRLEGVRRLDLGRLARRARRTSAPARTSRSAGTPRRPAPRPRTPPGPASPTRAVTTSTTIADAEHGGDDGQHPRLAQPVEQPPLHDRAQHRWRSCTPPTARRPARRTGRGRSRAARCRGCRSRSGSRATSAVEAEPQGTGMAEHGAVAGEHRRASVGHDGAT